MLSEKENEKRIKEIEKIFQKKIDGLEKRVDDLEKEVKKLEREKMDETELIKKLKEIFGEKNFDENNHYIGGGSTTIKPPVSNPLPNPGESKPSNPSGEPGINDP